MFWRGQAFFVPPYRVLLADILQEPPGLPTGQFGAQPTIPAGETSALVAVNVNNDDTPGSPETFVLGITLPTEHEDVVRIGVPSSQTITIAASTIV